MKRHAKTVVGIVLSVLLLAWAMRDVSPATVAREVGDADPALFAASILVSLGGFAFRAVRWGILLRPVAPNIGLHARFAATIIGFAANNVLPARVGEFARALSLGRIGRIPAAAAFATLVVERIFDGLVLVALLFVSMAATAFPAVGEVAGVDPRDAAAVVAGVMFVVALTLVGLVLAPHRSVRLAEAVSARLLPTLFRKPLLAALHAFLQGLSVLRSGPLFLLSAVLAVGQWVFTAWSFYLGFRAFGITEVPFTGAVFLQSLISLAVAIPSSPGFFGPFEAAAKFGLGLWSVDADKAVSFAVGYHLGGFIPVTLMGLYYVWRLNLRWSEVQHSDRVVEQKVEAAAPSKPPVAGRV